MLTAIVGGINYNSTSLCICQIESQDEVYLCDYKTLADVKSRLLYSIEVVYNLKRVHSAPGYRPPNEFELGKEAENENWCF